MFSYMVIIKKNKEEYRLRHLVRGEDNTGAQYNGGPTLRATCEALPWGLNCTY